MKLFKKALLATAIFGAMGAQAADVTDAVQKTSIQGLEIAGAAADSSVRVIVREQLEAGDTISLQFGDGIDLSDLDLTTEDGTVAGELTVDDTGGNTVTILYGSGTYTVSIDAANTDVANNILALEVNTGDPITLDSSFEVSLAGVFFDVANVSDATVTYSATSGLTGNAKDTTGDNVGSFIVLEDQYTASIEKKFNGVLERTTQTTFSKNGDASDDAAAVAPFDSTSTSDGIYFTVTDKGTAQLSPVGAAVAQLIFTVEGDFSDYTAADATPELQVTVGGAIVAPASAVVDTAGDLVITMGAAALDDTNVFLTLPTGEKLPVTDFDVTVDVEFGGADVFTAIEAQDAGEWMLDATVIKVPYFPVGYTDLDTSVHFANDNTADANVIMTAYDDETGTEYEAVDMGDLAGEQVTKFSQTMIKDALGIAADDSVKLSVTFNINADSNTVRAYAFSRDKAEGSRHSLSVQ